MMTISFTVQFRKSLRETLINMMQHIHATFPSGDASARDASGIPGSVERSDGGKGNLFRMMLIDSPTVQHLFHRFAVPLLLRRRNVLIHSTVSGKILEFISDSLGSTVQSCTQNGRRFSTKKKRRPFSWIEMRVHDIRTIGFCLQSHTQRLQSEHGSVSCYIKSNPAGISLLECHRGRVLTPRQPAVL